MKRRDDTHYLTKERKDNDTLRDVLAALLERPGMSIREASRQSGVGADKLYRLNSHRRVFFSPEEIVAFVAVYGLKLELTELEP